MLSSTKGYGNDEERGMKMKMFITLLSLSMNTLAYSNSTFVCEEGVDCPDTIVLISNQSTVNEPTCLGTVIEKNKVLTSASCLKNIQASFDCKSIAINFLSKTNIGQKKCNEVESISYRDFDSDYAILKLDYNVSLKPTRLNITDKLNQDSTYTTWSLVKEEKQKVLKQEECKTVFNSYANPTVKDGSYTNIPLHGCNLNNASSGTPIILDNILYGVFSKKIDSNLINKLYDDLLIDSKQIDISFMTNIACLNIAGNLPSINCNNNSKNVERERDKLIDLEQYYSFSELLNEAQLTGKNISSKFEFSYEKIYQTNVGRVQIYTPSEVCFKKNVEWVDEHSRPNGRLLSYSAIKMTLPEYNYGVKLDSKLNIYKFEEIKRDKEVQIGFSPRGIKYYHETNLYLKRPSFRKRLVYKDIKECK